MKLLKRRPLPALDRFVNGFWVFESSTQPQHAKERALPDGCAQLIINLREDRHRVYDRQDFNRSRTTNGCLVVGPQSEFCVIDSLADISFAGVHFRPGGLYPFFDPPCDELHGEHVPLDALWGRWAEELRERLLEAETAEERLCILEEALLARARKALVQRPVVTFAIGEFERGPCAQKIAEVAERSGFSPRRFIDLFRQEVGLTPKRFCRVRRFQQALQRMARGLDVRWTDVALEAGYFDQAHFIHDFRAFAGINPSTYWEARPQHANHVPLADSA